MHTSSDYDEDQTEEEKQRPLDFQNIEQVGNTKPVESKKDEDSKRSTIVEPIQNYFDDQFAAGQDRLLESLKEQGYVSFRCLIPGTIVLAKLREQIDPCMECDCVRDTCGGRIKQEEATA
jgi:hypothetical protein